MPQSNHGIDFVPADTRSYSEHLCSAHDGREIDLSGLKEQNGRLQRLVGELLQKNQELRQEVAHLHREQQFARA